MSGCPPGYNVLPLALSLIKSKLSKTGDSDRLWWNHALVEDENEAMCPCCRRFLR